MNGAQQKIVNLLKISRWCGLGVYSIDDYIILQCRKTEHGCLPLAYLLGWCEDPSSWVSSFKKCQTGVLLAQVPGEAGCFPRLLYGYFTINYRGCQVTGHSGIWGWTSCGTAQRMLKQNHPSHPIF